MTDRNVDHILIDECILNILEYRSDFERSGYSIYDLRKPETDPLTRGVSDQRIFNWLVERQMRMAVLTLNVKDFRKINGSSEKKIVVLKAPSVWQPAETLIAALDFINTLPSYTYYSLPLAISKLGSS